MFGNLFIALMLGASSNAANPASPPAQAYEVKKVCRSVQEIGSLIPQRVCTTKRVPIEKPGVDNPKGGAGAGSKLEPR